jgi:hypothetical protein
MISRKKTIGQSHFALQTHIKVLVDERSDCQMQTLKRQKAEISKIHKTRKIIWYKIFMICSSEI